MNSGSFGSLKVVVVGAGLAGLAAGTWLKRSGHQVEVFEASARVGGRAKTIRRPGTDELVDVGTQYFHSNYRRAHALMDSVGLAQNLRKIRGKTRFFDDRVKQGSFVTGHRFPYIASGSVAANVRMNLAGAWRLLRNWIDPFAVLQGVSIDDVSARDAFSDPFEWEYNARALIMAGALVEPEDRRESLLHVVRLMRIIVLTDYLTLDGGIASLHERLAEDLTVRLETAAARVLEDGSGICGIMLEDGTEVDADHVILATPPAASANLLPREWEHERAFLSAIWQPPAIVVTLFLDRPLEDKIWSYVFRPEPGRLVSFCVDASQKNPVMTKTGRGVLQAWICHPASADLISLSAAEIVEMVTGELTRTFGRLDGDILHSHVNKVPHAIPQMGLGHNARARDFLDLADRRRGIEFCGDYLSGGYMECALWSAERAVKNVLSSRHAGP